MLCSTCHKEIPDDAKTCPFCGIVVDSDSTGVILRRRPVAHRLRIAVAVACVVAIASTGFGVWSWRQRSRVSESYEQAQANESESLAAKAEQLLAQGDRMEAIQVALAALPQSSADKDRPLVPSAQLALERALQVYPQSTLWRSCYNIKEVGSAYALSPDGLQAFEGIGGRVSVRSVADGSRAATLDARGQIAEVTGGEVGAIGLQFVGERLLCRAQDGIALFDAASGSLSWRAAVDGFAAESDIIASPDAEHLVIGCSFGPAHVIGDDRSDEVIVRIIDASDGAVAQGFRLPLDPYGAHTEEVRLAYAPNGDTLAVANSGRLWLIDLPTGDVRWVDLPAARIDQLAFADESVLALCSPDAPADDADSIEETVATQVVCYATDPYLYQLWSLPLDAAGSDAGDAAIPHILGSWPAEDGPDQIVIACGRSAYLLAADTGEVVWQTTMAAPVRAAMVDKGIYLVDCEGSVEVFAPGSADASVNLAPLAVAEGTHAAFGMAEGTPYLAAYDESASTYRIYRLAGHAAAPSRDPRQSKYLHTHLETVGAGDAGQLVISGNEEEVAALDAITLKRQWKRSFAKLGLAESTCGFSCGTQAVYVYEAEHGTDGPPVICVISPTDGKTVDRIELPEDWDSIDELREWPAGDATRLVIRSRGTAAVINPATHQMLLRVTAASGQILGAWLGSEALLVLEAPSFGDTTNGFELFSLANGASIDSLICACEVKAGGTDRLVTIDPTGTTLAVSCADGIIRTFGTQDWAPLWKGVEELPGLSVLSYAPDGSALFAQDASGSCLLLSASDGHVLAASSATLPAIDATLPDATHPDRITATYRLGEGAGEVGILSISLAQDGFGPLSETYSGLYYTPDDQQVLAYDAASDPAFSTYHRYTLDELLGLGRETVAGHELTDAERRLYRIPS